MDEFNTNPGVVPGGGSAEPQTMPDSGGNTNQGETWYAAEEAQDLRGPWNNNPRFRDVIYPGYKWAKENKAAFEQTRQEYQRAQEELRQYREGRHESYTQRETEVETRTVTARDQLWTQAAEALGVKDLFKEYFEAKRRGNAPQARTSDNEDAPWKSETAKLQERLDAYEMERKQQQMTAELNSGFEAAIKGMTLTPEARKYLEDWTVHFAGKDIDTERRQLRQPVGAYVKMALEHIKATTQHFGGGNRPAATPPKPGPRGGAPGGDPIANARAQQMALIQQYVRDNPGGG